MEMGNYKSIRGASQFEKTGLGDCLEGKRICMNILALALERESSGATILIDGDQVRTETIFMDIFIFWHMHSLCPTLRAIIRSNAKRST